MTIRETGESVPDSWMEMEEVVGGVVLAACHEARKQGGLAAFYREMRTATNELYKLGERTNVDYALPRSGEAYALWYHMRRTANAYDALQTFKSALGVAFWDSKPFRVLDIGSGTGAVEMALMRWLADNEAAADADPFDTCTVTCIEASPAMASVSLAILGAYTERLDRELDVWVHTSILEAWSPEPGTEFDLIVFSTTFDFVTGDARGALMQEVVDLVTRHLANWGLVLFIVPKSKEADPLSKWSFVQEICDELTTRGGLIRQKRDADAQPCAPADSPQEGVLAVRELLYAEACTLNPPITLYRDEPGSLPERQQPRYFADVYPLALRKKP